MRRLRQKISGRFWAEQGAWDSATLDNMLSRARKRSRNRLDALLQRPDLLFAAIAVSRAAASPAPGLASGCGRYA